MRELFMRFVGEEQINSFLNTYMHSKNLADAFDLFHIPQKDILKVTVEKTDTSDRYLIHINTSCGVLSVQEDLTI